jgi:hypothetical protein
VRVDHHLHHALKRTTVALREDGTEEAWQQVEARVQMVLDDKMLIARWRAVFDWIANKDVRSIDFKGCALTSVRPADANPQRHKHDYLTVDAKGTPCIVDGMCKATRGMIPLYSDRICLGSVLAGIDKQSPAGAREHFDGFRDLMLRELGEVMAQFDKGETEPFVQRGDVAFDSHWTSAWLASVKDLAHELSFFTADNIYKMVPRTLPTLPAIEPLLVAARELRKLPETEPQAIVV